MGFISHLLGSGLFFAPFLFVPLYLCIERGFGGKAFVQCTLKTITVLGGLFLMIYGCAAAPDIMVLMPSGRSAKNEVPASIFLAVSGAALAALPLYSKYIKFSNERA